MHQEKGSGYIILQCVQSRNAHGRLFQHFTTSSPARAQRPFKARVYICPSVKARARERITHKQDAKRIAACINHYGTIQLLWFKNKIKNTKFSPSVDLQIYFIEREKHSSERERACQHLVSHYIRNTRKVTSYLLSRKGATSLSLSLVLSYTLSLASDGTE